MQNESKSFRLVPMREEHGRDICTWRYSPPYDLYNWDSWDQMVTLAEEFGDPKIREAQYRAVLDESGELCGFAQFFPMVGVTRLGLGLRPDLCGQGSGVSFVRAIVQEAERSVPGCEIDLEVLTWNKRAIRTYERAGFVITDTYERPTPEGSGEFHCMVWTGMISEEEKSMGNNERPKAALLAEFRGLLAFAEELRSVDTQIWDEPLAPGKWSLKEVTGHLLLWDQYFYESAIGKIAESKPLTLKQLDFNAFNARAAQYGREQSGGKLVEELVLWRSRLADTLEALPEAEFRRSFPDLDGKPFIIADYIPDFVWHDRHHIKQIREFLSRSS